MSDPAGVDGLRTMPAEGVSKAGEGTEAAARAGRACHMRRRQLLLGGGVGGARFVQLLELELAGAVHVHLVE